jgi:serine/threonine protein kinase
MKKPARIATGGTIQRQSGQIAQEGLALEQLDGLPKCKAHPPELLDRAQDFTRGTANYFIVSEVAPGVDMATLLTQTRQEGKPFPRRVIITVLDALFDLFARAHRAGVLWNDVKLEHIYWDNPTGGVAVIDWGNAQFLESDESNPRSLPRWEDYRQMVDTLGVFLQQSAPELYDDLGWAEFQGSDLDLPRISVLARRIAYQQEVVALRVMEYQSLIRVVIAADPSLPGLQKIRTYQQILEQIGAPWESEGVLVYSQALVFQSLAAHEIQTAIRVTGLVWDLFGESLNLAWHLLREYFRYPEILSNAALGELASATLNEKWSAAIWSLATIAQDEGLTPWWDQLIPVLRQKALGLVTPPPYQSCQTLLTWLTNNESASQAQAKQCKTVLSNWRLKGTDLQESPFEYAILEMMRADLIIPRRIRTELKTSFAAGEEAIRELLQAWVNMDWDGLPKAFRRVIGWDPDRWGVLRLAEEVDSFHDWLNSLYDGPTSEETPAAFVRRHLANRPQVERLLGSPPWLQALLHMLDTISRGAPLTDLQAGIQTWCPWLMGFETLQDGQGRPSAPDQAAARKALTHFLRHLRSWTDLDRSLNAIKDAAPAHYPGCKRLADGFRSVFHLNADLSAIETDCQDCAHPTLAEACDVLQTLIAWRRALLERNTDNAMAFLTGAAKADWRILAHAEAQTAQWTKQTLPLLNAFNAPPLATDKISETEDPAPLGAAIGQWMELHRLWQRVYEGGLHARLLDTLEESVEAVRSTFFAWRHKMEHSDDPVDALLYHAWLTQIRDISDILLRLAQHSRQAKLSFSQLGEDTDLPLNSQISAGENLLDHFAGIETLLLGEDGELHFPGWHQDFVALTEEGDVERRREKILALPPEHPLYARLVQSVLAQQ